MRVAIGHINIIRIVIREKIPKYSKQRIEYE